MVLSLKFKVSTVFCGLLSFGNVALPESILEAQLPPIRPENRVEENQLRPTNSPILQPVPNLAASGTGGSTDPRGTLSSGSVPSLQPATHSPNPLSPQALNPQSPTPLISSPQTSAFSSNPAFESSPLLGNQSGNQLRPGSLQPAGRQSLDSQWDDSREWDPSDSRAIRMASATQAEQNLQQAGNFLGPLERRYSEWWREVLGTSQVAGQPLELQAILRAASATDRVAMVREYWRLGEAIVAVQIHRESLETWQQATVSARQHDMVRTVSEMLNQQIEQAEATVVAEQAHLGLLLQRIGLPASVRPVDAPFMGPYETKLEQLQQRGMASTDTAVLAYEVDRMKQEILADARVLDWATDEWQRSQNSGDLNRMAAMIQLRQTAYLLWIGRVTRYNDRIAQYAYSVGGAGLSTQEQLAMLLRQPIVDGRVVTDLRSDPWFVARRADGQFTNSVQPVSFEQPTTTAGQSQFSTGQFPAAAGQWQPVRNR